MLSNNFLLSNVGDFNIPCPGEHFREPVGKKYVDGSNAIEDSGNINPKHTEMEDRNNASKTFDLSGSSDLAIA